jgi:tRNA(Ile)-lysidine synthase TilS/MesJ
LQEPRSVIDGYVGQLGLHPIEDPSNTSPDFRRNLLRHTILPQIEAAFPGASAALARYARLAADDDRALDAMAAVAMQGAIGVDGSLQGDGLRGQPLAVQRRMVRGWLLARTGLPMISADRTEAVLDLAEQDRGGRTIEIGEGWRATCRRGMLRLERTEREARRGA